MVRRTRRAMRACMRRTVASGIAIAAADEAGLGDGDARLGAPRPPVRRRGHCRGQREDAGNAAQGERVSERLAGGTVRYGTVLSGESPRGWRQKTERPLSLVSSASGVTAAPSRRSAAATVVHHLAPGHRGDPAGRVVSDGGPGLCRRGRRVCGGTPGSSGSTEHARTSASPRRESRNRSRTAAPSLVSALGTRASAAASRAAVAEGTEPWKLARTSRAVPSAAVGWRARATPPRPPASHGRDGPRPHTYGIETSFGAVARSAAEFKYMCWSWRRLRPATPATRASGRAARTPILVCAPWGRAWTCGRGSSGERQHASRGGEAHRTAQQRVSRRGDPRARAHARQAPADDEQVPARTC